MKIADPLTEMYRNLALWISNYRYLSSVVSTVEIEPASFVSN